MFAGFAVATLEAALGVIALSTGLAPYLFTCAAVTGGLGVLARGLLESPREGPGDDDEGGPPRGPDDPPPPPWWPDFEARFRAYAAERDRRRHEVH